VDPRFSQYEGELPRGWFQSFKNDMETEVQAEAWGAWVRKGGIVVNRADVERISRNVLVRETTIDRISAESADWDVALILAWIATRSDHDVSAVASFFAWDPMGSNSSDDTVAFVLAHADSRAIGWLAKRVSDDCKCEALGSDDRERWECCKCLYRALAHLQRELASGRLPVFDRQTRHRLPLDKVPRPQLQKPRMVSHGFHFVWPDTVARVVAASAVVKEIWPAVPDQCALIADGEPMDSSIEQWTEEKMRESIRTCKIGNRDRAWREIYIPIRQEHGWPNVAFRQIWPRARDTVGQKGRPKNKTEESA
jgi:hypothetical protein